MKTAIHASLIFCGALAVLLILCSTVQLSNAQRNKARPPPTTTPHFYDEYPIRRASIKKVLDGTSAALSFLGQASTQQGYLLPHHTSANRRIQFREAIAAAVKVYEIGSTFRALLSTNTGAMEIMRGLEADICQWISSSLLPETNFTCTHDNIRRLSKVMKVYQTLQDTLTKLQVIAPTTDEWQGLESPHYNCAWLNSRALNNCSTISTSQALMMALEQVYRCSIIRGDYDLCSNV